jgi:hypothetical protein
MGPYRVGRSSTGSLGKAATQSVCTVCVMVGEFVTEFIIEKLWVLIRRAWRCMSRKRVVDTTDQRTVTGRDGCNSDDEHA